MYLIIHNPTARCVHIQHCSSKMSGRGHQSGRRTNYPVDTATGKVVVRTRHLRGCYCIYNYRINPCILTFMPCGYVSQSSAVPICSRQQLHMDLPITEKKCKTVARGFKSKPVHTRALHRHLRPALPLLPSGPADGVHNFASRGGEQVMHCARLADTGRDYLNASEIL